MAGRTAAPAATCKNRRRGRFMVASPSVVHKNAEPITPSLDSIRQVVDAVRGGIALRAAQWRGARPLMTTCSLLQYSENAPVIGSGCVGLSPCSANRAHRVARPAWRAASPIRPDLGFRHAQGSRRASHNPLLLAFTSHPTALELSQPCIGLPRLLSSRCRPSSLSLQRSDCHSGDPTRRTHRRLQR
jgi:hypothetical protein